MQTPRESGRGSPWWYLLLLIPFVAMFWVSSYDKLEPSWGGVPFFYWYQLLWILIGAVLTAFVYLMTREG
jgi:FtsH-binding integral membrane protein